MGSIIDAESTRILKFPSSSALTPDGRMNVLHNFITWNNICLLVVWAWKLS